ncbi:hypothetical protein ABXN37_10750 [Piscinibacter sakaiensis]|uniref:hypothetical protein n=1 Tax=Piscinibacter sakaiensis TaxID=1547922 RepID=UPI003727B06A
MRRTTAPATAAATLFATVITAVVLGTLSGGAGARPVFELPRVVISGRVQRPAEPTVIELPRVVVTGRPVPLQTVVQRAEGAARGV